MDRRSFKRQSLLERYTKEELSKYILLGYTRGEPALERKMIFSGIKCVACVAFILFISDFLTVPEGRVILQCFHIFMLISTPFVGIVSIKLCQLGLKASIRGKRKLSKSTRLIMLMSIAGGIAGIGFARTFLSSVSYVGNTIFLGITSTLLIMLLLFFICGFCYKIYLIRKYCPHLKSM